MKAKKLQPGLPFEVLNERRKGLTFVEVLTVIAIIVVLAAVSVPAIDAFFGSMGSTGSAEAMINAALSNARANAMTRQKYVGVRFQKIYAARGPLHADQYMTFIINDAAIGAYAFKVLEGTKPIKLPDEVFVLDTYLITKRNITNPVNPPVGGQALIDSDGQINNEFGLTEASTFSIVFSPAGNVVIHGLYVVGGNDIFNTEINIDENGIGMFVQDDTAVPESSLGPEPSRRSFYICGRNEFKNAYNNGMAYSGCLFNSNRVHINPYTGKIIKMD